jgi:hypothetical protein
MKETGHGNRERNKSHADPAFFSYFSPFTPPLPLFLCSPLKTIMLPSKNPIQHIEIKDLCSVRQALF